MIFKWKDAYNCNIAEIDKQHKRLFEIGSNIYDVASLNDHYDHYDEIMEILAELTDYTIYHFSYEEELLQKHGFTGYEMHKVEHDFFVKKLKKISRKDIEGEQNSTLMEIVSFVADWISGHILHTDMNYRDFLSAKGVI